MRSNLPEREKNPKPAGSHKLAWSICGILFGLSFFAVITTGLQKFIWVRRFGSTPPPSVHRIIVASHSAFGLSALGILVLAALSIFEAARNR